MTRSVHPPANTGYPPQLLERLQGSALALLRGRDSPCVFAISGLQGSGKSTLALQLQQRMQGAGVSSAVLSVDDFYLDAPQRAELAHQVHSLLATRGPPGTHDLALALQTFAALRDGRSVALPRFDKLSDRRLPSERWPVVQGVELVIFEGWLLGTPAQDAAALLMPVNTLERDEDPQGIWRDYCNTALAQEYPALWQQIDHLLLLQAPSFDIVPEWRWQQEQQLSREYATAGEHVGMTRTQVERFVQLYERVSRQALAMLPALADDIVRLDTLRRVTESQLRSDVFP